MCFKNSFYYIFVISFCLFVSIAQLHANDIIEIPEIIVTSEKIEQTIRNSASTVNIITSGDIEKRNPYTFDQVLESISGVSINRSAETATNSMNIRGSSEMAGGGIGNRVLLLIDSRPAITADTGGANWGLFPSDIIERVEVIKGALSPLYGSNALGGIVNIITKLPTDSPKIRFNIGAGYYENPPDWMRYTEKNRYFGDVGITHSNTNKNLGYVVSLSGKGSDGYRQNTDFSLYNAYGKIQYITREERKLALSFLGANLDRGFPHSWLINNSAPYVHPLKVAYEKTNDRQKKNAWDVDLSLKTPISSKSKFSANIYHSVNYSKSLYNPNNMESDNFPAGFFTDSNAKKLGAIFQFDIYQFTRNYLILGLDGQIDMVDSNPADILFGKHQSKNLAGFMQNRIIIMDKLSAMFGARYDYRYLEPGNSEDQISPKLGLSYIVKDNVTLRFSIGQAFRAPSLAEIYMKQELNSGIKFRQNPNLKSEKLHLYAETGLKYNFSKFLSNDISVFFYEFSDMINWRRINEDEFQVVNISRSVITGVETSIKFLWKNLASDVNYTYLDAKDKTKGRLDDTLPYKPKHSANASLYYEYRRFRFGGSVRYVSKIDEAIFYPKDAPEAFYVVNTNFSYKANEQTIISVAINNLFNRQYEEIERYRMPGRHIIFRVIMDWISGIGN